MGTRIDSLIQSSEEELHSATAERDRALGEMTALEVLLNKTRAEMASWKASHETSSNRLNDLQATSHSLQAMNRPLLEKNAALSGQIEPTRRLNVCL